MSDLIDREEAINAVYHHFPHISMKDATMVLHEVPTAIMNGDMFDDTDIRKRADNDLHLKEEKAEGGF